MSMKKTDLEKLKGKKIAGGAPQAGDRFGKGSAVPNDKREQRERDRELGLIPFACKLQGALVGEVRTLAQTRGVDLNELVAELLKKGLKAK